MSDTITCPYNFKDHTDLENFFGTQICTYCNDSRKKRKNKDCWSIVNLIMNNKREYCIDAIKNKGFYIYLCKRHFLGIKRAKAIKERIDNFLETTSKVPVK